MGVSEKFNSHRVRGMCLVSHMPKMASNIGRGNQSKPHFPPNPGFVSLVASFLLMLMAVPAPPTHK